MDIAIYARLACTVNTTFTIILSWQLVKITVVHYSSSRPWLKKTPKMEKQHCEYGFLLEVVMSFSLIYRTPKYFYPSTQPTQGNRRQSNSNAGLVIFKVSNQMARHIVDDMYSIVCSGRVRKTASFNRRWLNSKQEIDLVRQKVPVVPKCNRSRFLAAPVIVGKHMDLLEPRFHWCAIFTSWDHSW